MTTCIAMLRGINVSGQKKISMADLRAMFEQAGFSAVKTYIQSGNVVFQSDFPDNLDERLENLLKERYGFEVPVVIRTAAEMREISARNHALPTASVDTDQLHVTFLGADPDTRLAEAILDVRYEPDTFTVSGKEIYIHCPNGYGNTKLHNNFFEKKLKVKATTRNWRTLQELIRMSEEG